MFWELQSHKTSSWGTPENVLILGSIWGAFPAPKLDPQIDEKSLLGAMLAPDAPKDHFGSILGSNFKHFRVRFSINFLLRFLLPF